MTTATPPRAGRVIPALLPDKLAAGETSPRFSGDIGATLRARGFVPLPRLWVPGPVANMMIRHAAQWADEVNEIRAAARKQSAHGGQIGTAETGRNVTAQGGFRGGNTAPHAPGALTECATSCHRGRGQSLPKTTTME